MRGASNRTSGKVRASSVKLGLACGRELKIRSYVVWCRNRAPEFRGQTHDALDELGVRDRELSREVVGVILDADAHVSAERDRERCDHMTFVRSEERRVG